MDLSKSASAGFAIAIALAATMVPAVPSGQKGKGSVRFAEVSQILQANCVSCHNAKSHPADVDLSSYDAVMNSGGDDPIVIPKHPEQSRIVAFVDGTKKPRMPFRKPPLSGDQIDLVKRWIKAGAKSQ